MIDSEIFAEVLFKGSIEETKKLVQEALSGGSNAEDILNHGLIKAMDKVGVKFKAGELYIPEVLVAARAMHAGVDVLKPILAKSSTVCRAKIVLGTVKGDVHDIGKNLVGMMFEGAGFEVIDIGVDAATEKFVQAVKEHSANIVALSALLTNTMMQMEKTVEKLKPMQIQNGFKVIVGGAPVSQDFADQIGADGYAPDAASAVDKVKELLKLEAN